MFDILLEKIFRYPRASVAVAGVLVILGAGLLWWQLIWQNPQRVFADMLANNMEAASVTKHASARNGTQAIDQYVRLQMGSTNAAQWLVQASQAGSTVETDSIGTPTSGYIRYARIDSSRQAPAHAVDFGSLVNVWGKSDGKTDTSLDQLFSQSVLDISNAPLPPIGNLPGNERTDLLNYIRANRVFNPAYNTIKRETIAGHHVYTYQVAVPLGTYIRLMQLYAHDLGMTSLDTLDPSQYGSAAPVAISLSVDRSSHQLVQASYKQTGFTQYYDGWGIIAAIHLPQKTITTTQLQQRIQQLGSAHP